jgi:hypothetical protein
MSSNSVMFILLCIFVIITLFAVAMCFKKNSNSNSNSNNQIQSEEEDLVNHVKNMNRTYNRFYWGNNELD